jgi:hypothetical protein
MKKFRFTLSLLAIVLCAAISAQAQHKSGTSSKMNQPSS